MESTKRQSWQRRRLNGLTDDFVGHGLDVGAGKQPAPWWTFFSSRTQVDTWDRGEGDAHFLATVADEQYDFLFASHILEHLENPNLALRNWVRVVRRSGVLLIAVPHRDLYERRKKLPSRWNLNHRRFYLPDRNEPPHTVGLLPWLNGLAETLSFEVRAVQTGDWGYKAAPGGHAAGEYQIDALLQRH